MGTKKPDPEVVMGRMVGPDGKPVSPEVEAAVWQRLADEVDQAMFRNMAPRAVAALARLAEEDPDTFQAAWPIIRATRLGAMSPAEGRRRMEELGIRAMEDDA